MDGSDNPVEGVRCLCRFVVVEGYSNPAEGLHSSVKVEGTGSLAGMEADSSPVEGVRYLHSSFVVVEGSHLAGVEGCILEEG